MLKLEFDNDFKYALLLRSNSLPSGTQCLSRVAAPDMANSRKKSSNDRPSISTQHLVTR